MALRYLETFHLDTTDYYEARAKLMSQQGVQVGSSGFYDTPGITGRFPGTTGFQADSSSYSNIILISQDFELTDTIRVAFDFKLGGQNGVSNSIVSSIGNAATVLAFGSTNPSNLFFRLRLDQDSQSGNYLKFWLDPSSTYSTNAYPDIVSVFHRIEYEINISAGTFRLWVNDNLEIDTTTTFSSQTGKPERIGFVGAGYHAISTIAIWDDVGTTGFTGVMGDFKPIQKLPSANGSVVESSVTGAVTAFDAVNDTFANGETDYNSLLGNGDKDLFTMTPTGESGEVITVVAQPAAFKNELGSGKIKAVVNSNGVEVESTNEAILVPNFDAYGQRYLTATFDTNPDTGSAWTVTEVDDAEWGYSCHIDIPS